MPIDRGRVEGSVGDGGSRLEGSDGVPVLRGKGSEVDNTDAV